ncbi:MAG: hypothetical protein NVSMB10_08020 [Steroidobacteraceae bacterium]
MPNARLLVRIMSAPWITRLASAYDSIRYGMINRSSRKSPRASAARVNAEQFMPTAACMAAKLGRTA